MQNFQTANEFYLNTTMQNKIKQAETAIINRSLITPADYNPRTISDDARKKLKKNIKENGIIGGMVWNKTTSNLVSGHQKLSILDEINKYDQGNDYELKVDVIEVDLKKEKELNIWFNSKAVQGEMDYKKLALMWGEIDVDLAGLDDVDISMIQFELPDVEDYEVPAFEPQEHKREAANEANATDDEQNEANEANATNATQPNNTIYHPDGKLEDLERAENEKDNEMSYEERKALVKEIKQGVKEGATIEGEPYFTISFDDYNNKVEFLERLGLAHDTKFIKGEELADAIDQSYAA